MTLTKEWLLKTIAELEEERNAIPGSVNEDAEMALAAMKLALSSLEAEPAIHRWRRVTVEPYGPYPWHYGNFIGFSKPVKGIEDEYFYSTPPAAVSVPDEIDLLTCHLDGVNETYAEGWNACRAAMLQGAAGNSPAIPDGSDDTKRLDWLDAQNKRLNEYYGTSYGWKFDANFQRNAMMLNDSNYPVMNVRQAIDEAIAAAPQQEAK